MIEKVFIHFWSIYNYIYFRLKGVSYGPHLRVFNRVYIKIHKKASLRIGKDFLFTSGFGYNALCRNLRGAIYLPFSDSVCKIGDGVGISSCCIWASKYVEIGDNVTIGGDTIIIDTDAHSLDFHIRGARILDMEGYTIDDREAKRKPIVIENNVFIGTRCIILKGITIGERSIIAAGSVVSSDIPPDVVAGGNPCKVIKHINQKINEN